MGRRGRPPKRPASATSSAEQHMKRVRDICLNSRFVNIGENGKKWQQHRRACEGSQPGFDFVGHLLSLHDVHCSRAPPENVDVKLEVDDEALHGDNGSLDVVQVSLDGDLARQWRHLQKMAGYEAAEMEYLCWLMTVAEQMLGWKSQSEEKDNDDRAEEEDEDYTPEPPRQRRRRTEPTPATAGTSFDSPVYETPTELPEYGLHSGDDSNSGSGGVPGGSRHADSEEEQEDVKPEIEPAQGTLTKFTIKWADKPSTSTAPTSIETETTSSTRSRKRRSKPQAKPQADSNPPWCKATVKTEKPEGDDKVGTNDSGLCEYGEEGESGFLLLDDDDYVSDTSSSHDQGSDYSMSEEPSADDYEPSDDEDRPKKKTKRKPATKKTPATGKRPGRPRKRPPKNPEDKKKRGREKQNFCKECQKNFTHRYYFGMHNHKVHGAPEPVKDMLCTDCGKSFGTSGNLQIHRKAVHMDIPQVPCPICNKEVKKTRMRSHLRFIHGDEDYCCDICGEIMRNQKRMYYHMKTVHGEKMEPHPCEWPGCGKVFTRPDNLQTHMLIHTGEMPIQCKLCEYRCRQQNSLNWHMKSCHTEEFASRSVKQKTFISTDKIQSILDQIRTDISAESQIPGKCGAESSIPQVEGSDPQIEGSEAQLEGSNLNIEPSDLKIDTSDPQVGS